MNHKSLKFKIFFIFSIPVIALIYFSYTSINSEYQRLQNISAFKLSTTITTVLSNLMHNLQIERGISSGYIVSEDKDSFHQKLIQQQAKTDEQIKKLIVLINSQSPEKTILQNYISFKARPLMKTILKDLHNIQKTRIEVQNSSIDFHQVVNYYTNLNKKILLTIKMFTSIFPELQGDAISIINLQELKEYAGLERAYTYNQLLSDDFNVQQIDKLKQILHKQSQSIEKFFQSASLESSMIYAKYFKTDIQLELENCREGVISKSMDAKDANRCFNISSEYINLFATISSKIINIYIKKADQLYIASLRSLYITTGLWIISIISLLFLTYFLKRLMNNEEQSNQELLIASYAFDSQEAMAVTDEYGTIIRINNAFTKITGYSEHEAIGQNPKILKSGVHDEKFFADMWKNLLEDGKWQGEVYNKRKDGDIYPEMLSITAIKNKDGITTNYIAQFLDISEIKKAQEIAEHQADHDFLTGLLNRKSLMQRLNEEFVKAKRNDFLHAFLFIDLDNFKSVNDNFGHGIGDKLIIEVSKRLKNAIREEDILSRISGDEFGVILLNLKNDESEAAHGIHKICTKILKAIAKEFILDTHTIDISSSIGIKFFPNNETNVNDVVIHADKAMYEAKKHGKNQFVFFDKHIESQLEEFSLIEKEIKSALQNDEFVFFYQPKVDAQKGTINGAEMLIRWLHPTKGLLYPNSFIDVAENIGVVHKFSTLALHSACKFIEQNIEIFEGSISINISSKEILHPNFEKEMIAIISEHGVNPSRLEFEITETAIIKDFDLVVSKIKKLQTFGIQFSIDDFGTGYSSITYLQKLPANVLKIDRSFFMNFEKETNRKLVKMIISMADTFNMKIIAEGIETKEQLEFIQKYKNISYQGFYFSKGVNESSFKELLGSPK